MKMKNYILITVLVISVILNAFFIYSLVIKNMVQSAFNAGKNSVIESIFYQSNQGPVVIKLGEKTIILDKKEDKKGELK